MNRRTFLATAIGTASVASLAGCLGSGSDDADDAPEPVDLSGTKFDYQGGMEIGAHGGPNGQIFYRDQQPRPAAGSGSAEGDGGPEHLAWFHTLVHGLFPYHFDRVGRGWEAEVVYVTDYSRVDWELPEDGQPVMPAPTGADSFAEASSCTFVGESEVMGGMGPALHPFSEESDASAFADSYGGTTYEFDEINRALVESLQQAGGGM